MSHSFSQLLYHMIWATKGRQPLILSSFQSQLYQYMGGVIRDMGGTLVEIGGMADHVHILVGLKPTTAPADAIRQIKRGSSSWMHKSITNGGKIYWQEGYGIFSVSYSGIESVSDYIRNQEAHHRNRSSHDEWLAILRRHGISFDVKYAIA